MCHRSFPFQVSFCRSSSPFLLFLLCTQRDRKRNDISQNPCHKIVTVSPLTFPTLGIAPLISVRARDSILAMPAVFTVLTLVYTPTLMVDGCRCYGVPRIQLTVGGVPALAAPCWVCPWVHQGFLYHNFFYRGSVRLKIERICPKFSF